MDTVVLPKATYNVLHHLTGETRPDVALSIVIKDLIHLRLDSVTTKIAAFEKKYGVSFTEFEEKWRSGVIPDPFSFSVEQDYWSWEAAITDLTVLEDLNNHII